MNASRCRSRSRRYRRLRSAAQAAASWLADAILADPELPADAVGRQVALLRLCGALARDVRPARLRAYRPDESE